MITPLPPRLILLPGLGIDERLFEPQRALRARIEVPAWLRFEVEETMEHYAQRMVETIDQSSPFFLGGVSFGGMLALEMAKYLKPQAVIAIAACRAGREVAWPFRMGGEGLPWMS